MLINEGTRNIGRRSAERGTSCFLCKQRDSDVVIFREGKFPLWEITCGMEVLDSKAECWTWDVEFADVSAPVILAIVMALTSSLPWERDPLRW